MTMRMTDANRFLFRRDDEDIAIMNRLAHRYGMNFTSLVKFALRFLDEHGPLQGGKEEAEPEPAQPTRVEQMDWLRDLANELTGSQRHTSVAEYESPEAYAEAIVEDYIERLPEEQATLPAWWTEYERRLLVEFIARQAGG